MTAPDATLTGRLRELVAGHRHRGLLGREFRDVQEIYRHFGCTCGWEQDPTTTAYEKLRAAREAHLADVAAQTMAAWLREQRETVAEATRDGYYGTERGHDSTWDELTESGKGWWRDAADAALAALVAAIGGAE